MNVEMKNIKAGTVIVVCGKLAIVEQVLTSRPKNPIQYKNNTDHRGYICGIGEVQAILGDVDLDAWNGATNHVPVVKVAPMTPSWMIPDELKDVKAGDIIEMKHGRGIKQVEYVGYNSRRPKYPISYKIQTGGGYKGTVASFIRKVRDGVEATA